MTLPQQSVRGGVDVSGQSGADSLFQSAVQKAALRFVPLLTIAYLFNYLDRTSLGFAALTMNQQLGLTASQFGLAAGIVFLDRWTGLRPAASDGWNLGTEGMAMAVSHGEPALRPTGLRDAETAFRSPASCALAHP